MDYNIISTIVIKDANGGGFGAKPPKKLSIDPPLKPKRYLSFS